MLTKKSYLSFFRSVAIVVMTMVMMPVHAYFFSKSPVPNFVQIKLSDVGVIANFKFEVNKNFPYWFFLNFKYPENDQVERSRIRKLLGGISLNEFGVPREPGIPTPILLTIFAVCKDGKEIAVYSQDVDPILSSWGHDHFRKNIGNYALTPGIYRAHLINKRASPEFSSIPITFEMGKAANVTFHPENKAKRREPCPR